MSAQFILGIVGTIIAAAMVWLCSRLFNKRQLYVISENLYKNSLLTDKGIVCEISIFNRGRQIEEDIELTLDNNLSYELLAYNDSNASLDNNIIKIKRLHLKSMVGILLLIEQGEFSYKKIHKVESKTEKGRVVEKLAEVPMNYVDLILAFFLFLLFIGLGGVGGYLFR
ncbi:hypothetical protein, partial [Acinetobacter sp.]|uniref:hypothetical protein n=2 Tax=Acinetobacter sp. TaxID=472 RepID=UPI00264772D5